MERILLAHGSGGRLSEQLIKEVFLPHFKNPYLELLEDQAIFSLPSNRIAFTTDTYVVNPLFFPGGDIGRLAISGTVNDLAVGGASPVYLSVGFILEEGLPLVILEKIVSSMAQTAREAGVEIVTGDTKVVEKGAADGVYINTAGIGVVPDEIRLGARQIHPGDQIIITGTVGDHGISILAEREQLKLNPKVKSDVAPLNSLLTQLLEEIPSIKALRDPTRGGVAQVLNEWASISGTFINIYENKLPVLPQVSEVCGLFGFDPLYLANEGKALLALPKDESEKALKIIKKHPLGKKAAIIGQVEDRALGKVILTTSLGGRRILDLLAGEILPRIC